MDPEQWMKQFRGTHERFKKGELNDAQTKDYRAMGDELARSLCASQKLTVPDGTSPRHLFRVAVVLPVEIANTHKTVTREVWRTGFSALVSEAYKVGEQISFGLTLGRGVEPITGVSTVTEVVRQAGNARISFKIESMQAAFYDQLEAKLFDAVLSRFG